MAPPRKFDHDQARELRAAGFTYAVIAEVFGVSPSAIARAVDPGRRERMNRLAMEYTRTHYRQDCPGCGKPGVWTSRHRAPSYTGLCRACFALARTTSVRDGELHCSNCDEWKPDDDFPAAKKRRARRGRHAFCRPCQAEVKRAWRARQAVAA